MTRPPDNPRLDDADRRLLRALATDDTMESVARQLGMSVRTLRRHSRDLYDRLGVRGRVEAAVWAAEHAILDD